MQDRSGTIQHDFLERSRVLNQIRSDVYLSGTYARDYLLDPQPSAAEKNRTELNRLRQEMEAILAGYAGLMRAEERAPLDGLRRSLDEYWRVLDPVFQWSPDQRRQGGFQFLRDEVFPRRLAMLGLADQIQGVNERQMDAGNLRVAALFSEFRARLGVTLTITLILGAVAGDIRQPANPGFGRASLVAILRDPRSARAVEESLRPPGGNARRRTSRALARAA